MRKRRLQATVLPWLIVSTALVVVACGGSSVAPSATQQVSSAKELTGLLATVDLGEGPNRVSFILISDKALINVPEANVIARFLPPDGSEPQVKAQGSAMFHLWPFGTRGNYSTIISFNEPGEWELEARVDLGEGQEGRAVIPLQVDEITITPQLGTVPPRSKNKTLADGYTLKQLTSGSSPDPDLYQTTIAAAITNDLPSLVVFASPAYCTSPTCGPQVETISELKEGYKGRANFVHVEVYDNPDQVQGDPGNARYAAAVTEWKIDTIEGYLNESWTFILDTEGQISSKFEGFASALELEGGLLEVLGQSS